MKVFISHSSKDKWAARRISEDLINLGAVTFLDEKDIETGQPIDASIRTHLKESDHFLILLSPASIKSEWVLLELGGALILEKKVIPVLFYVGANEIPQAINLNLSRDINNIGIYYNEIQNELKGKKTTVKRTVKPKTTSTDYKVGDRVKIISKKPKDVIRDKGMIDWVPEMDPYLGQESIITRINPDGYEKSYVLQIDDSTYIYAKEWLITI